MCGDVNELQLHQIAECTAIDQREDHEYLQNEESDMLILVNHFKDMRVAGLKEELKKRGLKSDGRKQILQQRLFEAEGLIQVLETDETGEEINAEISECVIANQEAAKQYEMEKEHVNKTVPPIEPLAIISETDVKLLSLTEYVHLFGADSTNENNVTTPVNSSFLASSPSSLRSLKERLNSLRKLSDLYPAPTSPHEDELDQETITKAMTAMLVDFDHMKVQLSDLFSFKDSMLTAVNNLDLKCDVMPLHDKIAKLTERTKTLENENAELLKEIMQLRRSAKNTLVNVKDSVRPKQGDDPTDGFVIPKKVAKASRYKNEAVVDKIPLQNRYGNFAFINNNQWMCDDIEKWDSVVLDERNDSECDNVRLDERNASECSSKMPVKKRPNVYVQENPESNIILSHRNKVTVPGNSLYSKITDSGKMVGIFGDSMIKRVLGHRIGKDLQNATTRVRPFLGATAAGVAYHIRPELEKVQYDKVVICAGTNNVPAKKKDGTATWTEQTPDEIAQEIINTGYTCKDFGVNDVYISLLCNRDKYSSKIDQINQLLIQYCRAAHFYYIDHSNIELCHLYDGLHIDNKYIHLYANNISQMLNLN